jgi:hypothetical protein
MTNEPTSTIRVRRLRERRSRGVVMVAPCLLKAEVKTGDIKVCRY